MDDAPIKVAHLLSTSYAGSTWLNLMLGAHPDAFSVGEVKAIHKVGRAVCTVHGEDCPVWSHYEDDTQNVYTRLRELTQRSHYIVNNSRKYLSHEDAPRIDAHYVHLVRDGRAIVASHLRKYNDRTLPRACRIWRREVRRNRRLVRRMARRGRPTITVHYESLQRHTERELRRLCDFLGLTFDPIMIDYTRADLHFLGGNRGTLLSMLDRSGRDLPPDPHNRRQGEGPAWDLDYYRKQKTDEGFRDERWKSQLTDSDLRRFELFTLGLNRRLGYPPATDRASLAPVGD